MRIKSKSNKLIDISLDEDKFYFPGDTIKGSITIQPKSAIKATAINIKFGGMISIASKEKGVIPVFQESKSILMNGGRSKALQPKLYVFPFEFDVPDNIPSAMELERKKSLKMKIHYSLTAILDRPMMPESLCPRVEYPVVLLEYINTAENEYIKPLEKEREIDISSDEMYRIRLSIPKMGYTKGESIPVTVIINSFRKFIKDEALTIQLIRKVEVQSQKNTFNEEHILKTNSFDLNIIGPYNFSQSITSHLLIRTTPPSIDYNDTTVKINYKIRCQLFTDKKTPTTKLDIPIVVGTYPPAENPIDDEDDEELGEEMIGDDSDEEDLLSDANHSECEIHRSSSNSTQIYDQQMHTKPIKSGSGISHQSYNPPPQLYNLPPSSQPYNLPPTPQSYIPPTPQSWRQSQLVIDPRYSGTIISNGSSDTTPPSTASSSIPDNYPRNSMHSSFMHAPSGYTSKLTSLIDMAEEPAQIPSPQRETLFTDPSFQSNYYEAYSQGYGHNLPPNALPSYQRMDPSHQRMNSIPSFSPQQDIPYKNLMPVSTSTSSSSYISPSNRTSAVMDVNSSSSDLSEDEEEGDLLGLIEKKKKKEEREKRRLQRMIYQVNG